MAVRMLRLPTGRNRDRQCVWDGQPPNKKGHCSGLNARISYGLTSWTLCESNWVMNSGVVTSGRVVLF